MQLVPRWIWAVTGVWQVPWRDHLIITSSSSSPSSSPSSSSSSSSSSPSSSSSLSSSSSPHHYHHHHHHHLLKLAFEQVSRIKVWGPPQKFTSAHFVKMVVKGLAYIGFNIISITMIHDPVFLPWPEGTCWGLSVSRLQCGLLRWLGKLHPPGARHDIGRSRNFDLGVFGTSKLRCVP